MTDDKKTEERGTKEQGKLFGIRETAIKKLRADLDADMLVITFPDGFTALEIRMPDKKTYNEWLHMFYFNAYPAILKRLADYEFRLRQILVHSMKEKEEKAEPVKPAVVS